jgi:hypothetical protein
MRLSTRGGRTKDLNAVYQANMRMPSNAVCSDDSLTVCRVEGVFPELRFTRVSNRGYDQHGLEDEDDEETGRQ